jgi:hypothetical protein
MAATNGPGAVVNPSCAGLRSSVMRASGRTAASGYRRRGRPSR